MFDKKIYQQRRAKLCKQVRSGLLLFLSNGESPMNYPANPFHYRQDSTFLYFFGLNFHRLAFGRGCNQSPLHADAGTRR